MARPGLGGLASLLETELWCGELHFCSQSTGDACTLALMPRRLLVSYGIWVHDTKGPQEAPLL